MCSYFFDDLKQLITHPAGRGTLLALMIIPGFYAWFNIIASRDPYGHTDNITIAVVNNDTGTIIGDQTIIIGESVIDNLRDNHNLGRKILDEYDAQEGVLKGKYYASIIIPRDFSNKLLSFLTDEPTKPILQYTVNEKINAIAPKITNAGIDGLSKAIEANFISSVYNKLFEKSNKIGKKFSSHRDDFHHVQTLTNDIMTQLPDIHNSLEQGNDKLQQGQQAIDKLQNTLPSLNTLLDKIIINTQPTDTLTQYGDQLGNIITMHLTRAELLIAEGLTKAKNAYALIDQGSDTAVPLLDQATSKLTTTQEILSNLQRFVNALDKIVGLPHAGPLNQKVQSLHSTTAQYLTTLQTTKTNILKGEHLASQTLTSITTQANKLQTTMTQVKYFAEETLPSLAGERENYVNTILKNINTTAQKLQQEIPTAHHHSTQLKTLFQRGEQHLNTALSHWDTIENTVKTINHLAQLLNRNKINALIEIMLINPEDERNFFRHPVAIETTKLFSAPNYGSAIAPFFTVLALRTGALLASSMLSAHHHKAQKEKHIRAGYLSRGALFVLLGRIQATIISLGNIFIFEVYIVHPIAFFGSMLLISTLFQILIYTMVFLRGKIGNVLAIIMLLLQLSAGSGTFPVELTNDLFIKLHPYIPFTYAINLLRETSLGMIYSIVGYNVFILCSMMIIIGGLGYLLAPYFIQFATNFNSKTKDIDIFT